MRAQGYWRLKTCAGRASARLWGQPRGAIVSLEQTWGLARGWYSNDPRDPNWRRKTLDEAQAFFTALGLTAPFWSLR